MRFSFLAIVTLTAAMSVSACFELDHACKVQADCCTYDGLYYLRCHKGKCVP
ncbi:hypothetical protein K503DRAFT_771614, partial [Rhizopogon vinicolor AM-OR11-026]